MRELRRGDVVAIKIIRRGGGDPQAAQRRFMAEARMCAALRHPHIVSVLDFGLEPDVGSYLVMEHLNGPSLLDQVREHGPLSLAEACRVAAQVAAALDLAHARGIVHRDLPGGMTLREAIDRDGCLPWKRGAPLLLDLIGATDALHGRGVLVFGLTPSIIRVATGGRRDRLVLSSAGVTEIQDVLAGADLRPANAFELAGGDGLYLAPELLIGEKPDGRTDSYTIGAIGYELFTGRPPLTATTLPQLVAAAFSGELVDPRTHAPELPQAAAECLVRCLSRRPDQRYAAAGELEAQWQQIIAGAAAPPRGVPPAQ